MKPLILGVNALFLWWLLSTISGSTTSCVETDTACVTGSALGAGVIAIFILFVWALVDVILYVLYSVTKRRA
jgi:hypothetical protein